MAQALVVYESMFGHARSLAEAIAAGLAESLSVECVEVGSAGTTVPDDLELLVVGAPNHQFGLSTPESRAEAAGMTTDPLVSDRVGLREWLTAVDAPEHKVAAATFDLRLHHPVYARIDRAASQAQQRLQMKGFRPLGLAEAFLVASHTGPLVDGEIERAGQWGRELAAALAR